MTRAWHRLLIAALAAGSLATAACNKPTPESCRKALANMQRLMGTDNLLKPADFETEVRACRGGSSRSAVECATKATTMDELHACDFYNLSGSDGSKAKPGKPGDKPAATPTDKPAATPTDKPAATPTDKPAATPTDKPAATPTDKPAATPTDKPAATP